MMALIKHKGHYKWVEINYHVYDLIKNPVRGRTLTLLPNITAVIKVKR